LIPDSAPIFRAEASRLTDAGAAPMAKKAKKAKAAKKTAKKKK
jgi:hypothetical protein